MKKLELANFIRSIFISGSVSCRQEERDHLPQTGVSAQRSGERCGEEGEVPERVCSHGGLLPGAGGGGDLETGARDDQVGDVVRSQNKVKIR